MKSIVLFFFAVSCSLVLSAPTEPMDWDEKWNVIGNSLNDANAQAQQELELIGEEVDKVADRLNDANALTYKKTSDSINETFDNLNDMAQKSYDKVVNIYKNLFDSI